VNDGLWHAGHAKPELCPSMVPPRLRRDEPSNAERVGAAARLAPQTMEVSIYHGLAKLPPYNPDLEDEGTL
jgi:hypothetical protein